MKKYLILFLVFLSIFIALISVTYFKRVPMESQQGLNSNKHPGHGRIVMLGNSVTFRTDWRILLNRNDVLNRGINGNTTGDMLKRLNAIIDMKPEYCFIMGGINDIFLGFSLNEIFENYVEIIKLLNDSGIRTVIQSTLYVSGALPDSDEINVQVGRLNQNLKEFSGKNAIPFIDLNRTMSKNHRLFSDYTVDGVHLSKKGYETWSQILIPFIKKLSS
ncbi:MAG: GDSL family lipase [Candidatus Aminicenantes bacterium]|nr:GDSL family lipase [Candidatus Aminicenantes bacterium]